MAELLNQGKLYGSALTCNGKTIKENVQSKHSYQRTTTRGLEKADIDERTILVLCGTGPIGYSGTAEVINMTAPGNLWKKPGSTRFLV
jgi:dihydroxyacid dehydratase/phosphogluconate dehydratase